MTTKKNKRSLKSKAKIQILYQITVTALTRYADFGPDFVREKSFQKKTKKKTLFKSQFTPCETFHVLTLFQWDSLFHISLSERLVIGALNFFVSNINQ